MSGKSGAVILRIYNAQLPVVPPPLKLRHPILAVVEEWSDETYSACLPIASLVGEGDTEVDALFALGEEILEFAQEGDESSRGWVALSALVEIPRPEVFEGGVEPSPKKLPALDLAKLAPFRVVIDDSGGESSGWPLIEARAEADMALIHTEGFWRRYCGHLSQRQAVELAEEIAALLNAKYGGGA